LAGTRIDKLHGLKRTLSEHSSNPARTLGYHQTITERTYKKTAADNEIRGSLSLLARNGILLEQQQAEDQGEQSDGFYDTDDDKVVRGSLARLGERITSASGTFTLHPRGKPDCQSTEDTATKREHAGSTSGNGATDEVHQQKSVNRLGQRRTSERDHDERSGLAVRITLLPAADGCLRSGAGAKAGPQSGQTQRTSHTDVSNTIHFLLLSCFDQQR